ncbi:hypothetical protein KCU65_g6342, partial [Aureobasidium melanogenum]
MTAPSSTPPSMLSILLDDKIVFKLDILFFFSVILKIIYCVGLFSWLCRLNDCLFFQAIARGFAAVNDYFGLAHDNEDDSSQSDSPNAAQDDQAISSEDDEHNNNHNKCCETTENHCSVCGQYLQAAQHASSWDIDTDSTVKVNNDAVPEERILSRAEGALFSIAAHLEEYVDDITQAEAREMLLKLRTLRSTIGSRVPLFIHQTYLPMNGFGPDAWYGEASLIDASIWLLKKNFPGCDEFQPDFSAFVENKENNKQESTEQKHDMQEQGERALEQAKQEEEYRSTSSHGQPETHVEPVASVEPDMPASPSSTSSYSPPVLTARRMISDVEYYGVYDHLRDLSEPEDDALVVKLKDHRSKLIKKRTNAIVGGFLNGKEHVLEV